MDQGLPSATPPALPGEAELVVDLDALAANYRAISAVAAGAEVAPVVKADGYGLGAGPVARRLWAEGARRLFVARVAEGVALRKALGPGRPAVIQVLDGCPPGAADQLLAHDLVPVLNSPPQVAEWASASAAAGRSLPAALHLDTGMNRLGLGPAEAAALARSPDALRGVEVELVMSQLACGTEPSSPMNAAQARAFAEVAALFPQARRSLAASGGVFLGPDYHLDLVRPGVSLYGGGPFGVPDARLQAVASVRAPILQLRRAAPGETIGYGARFRAERPMGVAVVAAGYADGVLRGSSGGGYGWIAGSRCPFVGRLSMDLIALDVTDCAAVHGWDGEALRPGAMVELIGAHVPVDALAASAGTVAYEVLTRLSPRLRRRYLGEVA